MGRIAPIREGSTVPLRLRGLTACCSSKGLIRISLPIPSNAQFTVKVVSDPYGCAMTSDSTGLQYLSMYRRPLPATNLGYLSAVMFDGRETVNPLNSPATFQANLNVDLTHQAVDATLGHAQAATTPTQEQLQEIVAFELSTHTAQQIDNFAGDLTAHSAHGGPVYLSSAPYYPGINDSLGSNPTGAEFDPNAFALFSSWQDLRSRDGYAEARESVARGEVLFNSAPFDHPGCERAQRRAGSDDDRGHLHDVPRYAERG